MMTTSPNRIRELNDVSLSWCVPTIVIGIVVAGWISLMARDKPATDPVADDAVVLQRCLQQASGMPIVRGIAELRTCFAANGWPLGD